MPSRWYSTETPGSYVCAVVVDNDSNDVVNGTLVDAIGTVVPVTPSADPDKLAW
jgi:hypothetical protein